jgi:hypothetical protein
VIILFLKKSSDKQPKFILQYLEKMKTKVHFTLAAFLFVVLQTGFAQSRWGIEFKGSRVNTTNSCQLTGGSRAGNSYFVVDNEEDLETSSQSLGVIYKLDDRNLLKFHLGSHQNGTTLSFTEYDDVGFTSYSNITVGFHYFQFAPSYCYRVINKKFIVPIEAGINVNILRKENDNYPIEIKKFNFDYEISTGLDYRIDSTLMVGLHGVFSSNISEYQENEELNGTYLPKQIGLELSVLYEFGKDNER